jgi:hypothetical protein
MLGLSFGLEQQVLSLGAAPQKLGVDHRMALSDHQEVHVLAIGVDLRHHSPLAIGISLAELDGGASGG